MICEYDGCNNIIHNVYFEIYVPIDKCWKKICMHCKRHHFKGEPTTHHHSFLHDGVKFLQKIPKGGIE